MQNYLLFANLLISSSILEASMILYYIHMSTEKNNLNMKKKTLLKYMLLFVVTAAIGLLNLNNIEKEKMEADTSSDNSTNQLLATNQDTTAQTDNQDSETFLKQTNLTKASSLEGKGSSTISMTEGFFIHHVNLESKDPASNSFYEAWLYKEKPAKEYFALGELSNKDGNYQITYVSELYRLDYPQIFISIEPQNKPLGKQPSQIVFKGEYQKVE